MSGRSANNLTNQIIKKSVITISAMGTVKRRNMHYPGTMVGFFIIDLERKECDKIDRKGCTVFRPEKGEFEIIGAVMNIFFMKESLVYLNVIFQHSVAVCRSDLGVFAPSKCNVIRCSFDNDNDNDNDKPIKSLLKGKGLLPPVGLARLDSG
jgi:hypothetical protein